MLSLYLNFTPSIKLTAQEDLSVSTSQHCNYSAYNQHFWFSLGAVFVCTYVQVGAHAPMNDMITEVRSKVNFQKWVLPHFCRFRTLNSGCLACVSTAFFIESSHWLGPLLGIQTQVFVFAKLSILPIFPAIKIVILFVTLNLLLL